MKLIIRSSPYHPAESYTVAAIELWGRWVDWPWSHQVNGTDQLDCWREKQRGWQGWRAHLSAARSAMMAGATDADADKQKGAWMRDDTRKRSAGWHIGYSESTGCRSVHAWDNYYSYSGLYQKIRGWRWIENWRIWSGERACTYICLHRRKGRYAGMHLFSLPYTIEYWSASSKKKVRWWILLYE